MSLQFPLMQAPLGRGAAAPLAAAVSGADGARVLVQVGSAGAAREAGAAGADALIVQGVEAGGHVQSVVGLLPLLAEVRRAVSLPPGRGRDRRFGPAAPRGPDAAHRHGGRARGDGHVRRPGRRLDRHGRAALR